MALAAETAEAAVKARTTVLNCIFVSDKEEKIFKGRTGGPLYSGEISFLHCALSVQRIQKKLLSTGPNNLSDNKFLSENRQLSSNFAPSREKRVKVLCWLDIGY